MLDLETITDNHYKASETVEDYYTGKVFDRITVNSCDVWEPELYDQHPNKFWEVYLRLEYTDPKTSEKSDELLHTFIPCKDVYKMKGSNDYSVVANLVRNDISRISEWIDQTIFFTRKIVFK